MRFVRYSVTWTRISIPFSLVSFELPLSYCRTEDICIPTISVSGKTGASPTSNPPNPHPISTTSTSLISFLVPARFVCEGSGFTNAGKCVAQSMCAGLRGLNQTLVEPSSQTHMITVIERDNCGRDELLQQMI